VSAGDAQAVTCDSLEACACTKRAVAGIVRVENKGMLGWINYIIIRVLFAVLAWLPHSIRVSLFGTLWRLAFVLIPRLRKTALINLSIAFPGRDVAWYHDIVRKNATEMGRLIADTVRLSTLDAAWVQAHVEIPALERYAAAIGKTGVLIATGHLGSFELLGHAIGLQGYPLSAVARRFKSPRLDAWWRGMREARGNTIIDREGAFREMIRTVSAGRSVAVLIDQNVKINHAVFVDWFSKQAATTRAFALAALKSQAPVFVAGMRYCGNDRYRVEAVECDFSRLYADETVSDEQKVLLITSTISSHYCSMIEQFPEGWFWIHRRWKTRPPGEAEKVYKG
jgi:KDO2-lipid IV(A) lauroyltransferase